MKRVLVFGTFDRVHKGHLEFLRQAKECGDYLIVVVGRDAVVGKIKGQEPILSENERAEDLRRIPIVNEVLLGNIGNPYKIIEEIKPDVICLGYDQNSFTEGLQRALDKLNSKTKVVRLKAFKPEKYHSSILNK